MVVSGGQGADEHISEAQGMYDYLVAHGLEADRILLEDQSVNTVQNLAFSAKNFDKEKDEVLIVSNNFHVFRAVGIARRQGYQKVSGLAARGYWFLLPNNMLREFVGEWQVLRTGADFRLKCVGCGHQIMIPRRQLEKNVKGIRNRE